ncbi:MAG: hypothetical protein ACRER3_26055 [Pseudomonas fluorescens]
MARDLWTELTGSLAHGPNAGIRAFKYPINAVTFGEGKCSRAVTALRSCAATMDGLQGL